MDKLPEYGVYEAVEVRGGPYDGIRGVYTGVYFGVYQKNEDTVYVNPHWVKPRTKTQKPLKIGGSGSKVGESGEKAGQSADKVGWSGDFAVIFDGPHKNHSGVITECKNGTVKLKVMYPKEVAGTIYTEREIDVEAVLGKKRKIDSSIGDTSASDGGPTKRTKTKTTA